MKDPRPFLTPQDRRTVVLAWIGVVVGVTLLFVVPDLGIAFFEGRGAYTLLALTGLAVLLPSIVVLYIKEAKRRRQRAARQHLDRHNR